MRGTMATILVLVMSSGLIHGVAAQQLGSVYRLVEGRRGHDVDSSERVIITDSSITELRYAARGDGIFYRDLVRLMGGVRVDLRLDHPAVTSQHVLGTDAGSISGADVDWIPLNLAEQGIYEIRADARQIGGVEFWVKRGLMYLELLQGGISVRAAGTVAHVDGTEVLFLVDASDERGLLYLREGSVRFPEYPSLQVAPQSAWQLQAGVAPQLLNLAPPQVERWEDLVRYNREKVWQRPFWRRPGFYVPAGIVSAGLVGVGVCALVGCFDDDGGDTAQGTVVVTWPQ